MHLMLYKKILLKFFFQTQKVYKSPTTKSHKLCSHHRIFGDNFLKLKLDINNEMQIAQLKAES